jgi:hypothetical protein
VRRTLRTLSIVFALSTVVLGVASIAGRWDTKWALLSLILMIASGLSSKERT